MVEFSEFIFIYGLRVIIIAKIIEVLLNILPTPLRPPFRNMILFQIRLPFAIIGLPLTISGEMFIGFIIGKLIFGL